MNTHLVGKVEACYQDGEKFWGLVRGTKGMILFYSADGVKVEPKDGQVSFGDRGNPTVRIPVKGDELVFGTENGPDGRLKAGPWYFRSDYLAAIEAIKRPLTFSEAKDLLARSKVRIIRWAIPTEPTGSNLVKMEVFWSGSDFSATGTFELLYTGSQDEIDEATRRRRETGKFTVSAQGYHFAQFEVDEALEVADLLEEGKAGQIVELNEYKYFVLRGESSSGGKYLNYYVVDPKNLELATKYHNLGWDYNTSLSWILCRRIPGWPKQDHDKVVKVYWCDSRQLAAPPPISQPVRRWY